MKKQFFYTLFCLTIMATSLQAQTPENGQPHQCKPVQKVYTEEDYKNNPLIQEWKTPYQTPPFDLIKVEHYLPAFYYALEVADKEIYMISDQKSTPTFENTIVALDRSGKLLTKISNVFFNMLSANTSSELQKIAQEIMGVQMAFSYTGSVVLPPLFGFLVPIVGMRRLPFFLLFYGLMMWLASERLVKKIDQEKIRKKD